MPEPTQEQVRKYKKEITDNAVFIGIVLAGDLVADSKCQTNDECVMQAFMGPRHKLEVLATYKGSLEKNALVRSSDNCSTAPALTKGGVYRVAILKNKDGSYYASQSFLSEDNWRWFAKPSLLNKKTYTAEKQCSASGGFVTFDHSRALCSFYVKE